LTFQPQNNLERKLVIAANDPASRLDFYKELQGSNIFVIHSNDAVNLGEGKLSEGEVVKLLNIEMNGKAYIPIFSSLPRLQEFVKEEVRYLSLNAIEFFNLTKGADVFLNPGSSYGKEFIKVEIESIISGSILNPSHRYEIKKDTQVTIGQPAILPIDLINALIKLFSTLKSVKCAYNAHFYNPEIDEKPHTLIAIEINGNWDDIVSRAGMIADSIKIPDPPVDFIQLNGKSGLEQYFRSSCKPFYKKKIMGIF
jgi:hypothetical protein